MAKLAPLQPVSSHPEVSLAADQSGEAAKCTMSFLARKPADHAIGYNQSPFVFGRVELGFGTKDEPFLEPNATCSNRLPIFLSSAETSHALLAMLTRLLQDDTRDRMVIADICRALQTILPNWMLHTSEACDSFYARNADWRSR